MVQGKGFTHALAPVCMCKLHTHTHACKYTHHTHATSGWRPVKNWVQRGERLASYTSGDGPQLRIVLSLLIFVVWENGHLGKTKKNIDKKSTQSTIDPFPPWGRAGLWKFWGSLSPGGLENGNYQGRKANSWFLLLSAGGASTGFGLLPTSHLKFVRSEQS